MNDLKKRLPNEALDNIIGTSVSTRDLVRQIKDIAPLDLTVLISGETGSGKELVAKALHQTSNRNRAPFAALNCASISPQLFESELFGHEKGAFTGAHGQHKGIFEQARGGTVFLDEIGELPLDFQAKLLRVLESRTIRRVGGKEEIPIDVRIIAATHRDLHVLVENTKFREDLFYRLHVVSLRVPPLRERVMDIPLLAEYFLKEIYPEKQKKLTRQAIRKLLSHDWPGNVRELKNVISRSFLYCTGHEIKKENIHFNHAPKMGYEKLGFKKIQDNLIEEIYRETKSVRLVAKILGIGKSTVQRKLKKKIDLPVDE